MQHFLIIHIDLLKLFIYNYSITRFLSLRKDDLSYYNNIQGIRHLRQTKNRGKI